jgi:hypothetical protein
MPVFKLLVTNQTVLILFGGHRISCQTENGQYHFCLPIMEFSVGMFGMQHFYRYSKLKYDLILLINRELTSLVLISMALASDCAKR